MDEQARNQVDDGSGRFPGTGRPFLLPRVRGRQRRAFAAAVVGHQIRAQGQEEKGF